MTTFRELKPGMHLFYLSEGRGGFETLSHNKIDSIETAGNGNLILRTIEEETLGGLQKGRIDSVDSTHLDDTYFYCSENLWHLISDVNVAKKMLIKRLRKRQNHLQLAVNMMEFNLYGLLDFDTKKGFDYDAFFVNLQTIERTKELFNTERKKVVEAFLKRENWREFLNNRLYTYIKQEKIRDNDKVIGIRFSLPTINRTLERIDISVDFENREPVIATTSDYSLKNFIKHGTF